MRTLDVRLAAILLAVTVVFGTSVYFLHGFQVKRNANVFLQEAERSLTQAKEAKMAKNVREERDGYRNAIRYLGWYVRLVPDDVDNVAKLATLLADRAKVSLANRNQNNRLFGHAFTMLERVLRQDPDRKGTRRRLIEMLMTPPMYRYKDAKEHIDYLLNQSHDDPELYVLLGRCNAATSKFKLAEENFQKAINLSPNQIEVYPLLAAVLRYRFSRNKEADQLMERLVRTNPESVRAHILRGSYLKDTNAPDEALKEAKKSLELAPDNRDSLWLAAQCYLAKQQFGLARECTTRGIELYPDNVGLFLTMAEIEMRAGKREKAIEAIDQGLKVTERNPQLLWAKANLLIDLNQLKEAKQVIEDMRTTDYYKPLIDYLSARVAFAQKHWLAARQGFERIRGSLNQQKLLHLLKQADVLIGQCYRQLGNHDLEVEAYRRVLNIDSTYTPARAALTDALMNSGDVDRAIAEFNRLEKPGKGKDVGQLPLARMLILQNLQKASKDRDWGPAEKALADAERVDPNAIQIPVLRAEILVAKNRLADADALLLKARNQNPQQPAIWTALISLAERQRDWHKTEQLLEEAQKRFGDTVGQRLAMAQYLMRRHGKEAIDRLRKLGENSDRFSESERLRLWNGLLSVSVQVGDEEKAKQLCERIAEKEPNNVHIRYMAFEQALRAQDNPGMERALRELEQIGGQQNAYWLYGSAVRLSMQVKDKQGPSPQLDKALEYLAQARDLSPSWSRIPLLMGGIYDQEGQVDLALKSYREAIDMGERNPDAIRRTVHLLFQRQRYQEAEKLLGELGKDQVALSPDMTRANAEIALRRGEFDRALELARKSAATQSKNYLDYVWLGQMLAVIGHRAKAEGQTKNAEDLLAEAKKALRRATELEPKNAAPWVTLVQFLSSIEAEDEAEKAVNEAAKNIPAKESPLALAQCYEVMKKTDAAEQKYQAALNAAPDDPLVVRGVADFYYRNGKPVPAEALLRKIIDGKIKSPETDVIWARRQLAIIFATRGGYTNLQKARELIEQNMVASKGSAADRRLKAGLDASDPTVSRRDDAIHGLETLLQEDSATPEDRFRLAQMYLAAGQWVKASAQFRNLVGSHGNEPKFLVTYIDALLGHNETSSAEVYLDRLEKILPNHFVTVGMRAELLLVKNKPDKAFAALGKFLDSPNARPPDRKIRVRFVAEKLEKLAKKLTKPEQKPIAEHFVRQSQTLLRAYVDQNPGQDWVMIAFLARQGRIEDGLNLLDRVWEGTNPVLFSRLCSLFIKQSKIDKGQLQRLDRILQTALKQFSRSVPLLLTKADLDVKLGRFAEAAVCYREVLEKNSGNAYAMNNLAVLLALQNSKLDDSLQLVNRAIEIAGPVGAMLDSRATVYIAMGRSDKALADLTVALADSETPVRLFHQAQAYDQAGRRGDASSAIDKAMQKGLTKEMLHPLELPAFEKLRQASQ
jgi:tetratricopeptide (TPR) repeat protein